MLSDYAYQFLRAAVEMRQPSSAQCLLRVPDCLVVGTVRRAYESKPMTAAVCQKPRAAAVL
jgi:hypothetical protein